MENLFFWISPHNEQKIVLLVHFFKDKIMAEKYDFEDIRPFYDHEANDALTRMSKDPLFDKLINYFWPGMNAEQVQEKVNSVQNVHDFHF